jgi:hypothetical protein
MLRHYDQRNTGWSVCTVYKAPRKDLRGRRAALRERNVYETDVYGTDAYGDRLCLCIQTRRELSAFLTSLLPPGPFFPLGGIGVF